MLNGVSGTHNKSVAHISFPAKPNRLFKFHKRGQLFIRAHNETLSRAALIKAVIYFPFFLAVAA